MKDRITQSMVAAGIPASKADAYWQAFVTNVCDGDEPSEVGISLLKDAQIEAAMKPLAAAAVIAAIRGKGDKAKRYKPGRAYSAREYADFYAADPENADLVSDITRATTVDGKPRPWVIAPGKFRPEPSAQYIQWHMDEDTAPSVVMVDGAPVAPCMPGEERKKAARLYYVDPFNPNALEGFLDVNMVSPRTKASFVGYTDEALSAMQFLWLRELQAEGTLALRQFAEAMRGKEPAGILSGETLAAWNAYPKGRPEAKRAKVRVDPFAEPTARIPAAGAVGPVPSWLASFPVNWSDKVGIAFRGAVAEAIPDARAIARRVGIASYVNLSDTPRNVWHDMFGTARNANKHEALWAAIAEEAPALCAPDPRSPDSMPTIHVLGAEHEPAAAEKLRTHLARRIRANELRLTTDKDVRPGQVTAFEKERMLREATVVAVLVSAETMANIDRPTGKRVVPVIVRACMWRPVLGNLAPLPRNGKADSEEAWLEVSSALATIASGVA